MDSTPNLTFTQPISIKPSPRKLPIKRKSSDSSSPPSNPSLYPSPAGDEPPEDDIDAGERNAPPFKFHRIWTEVDEIRFLQGLLDCSADGLSFPRDLGVFYARFSETMSQPYTRSQLSEKLRRLRKKFRVISSRLSRGLDRALLSPHDQSLFELSQRLWDPEFSSSSPFGANNKPKKSNLVGVKVSFSPTLPPASVSVQTVVPELNDYRGASNYVEDEHDDHDRGGGLGCDIEGSVKLSDVNIEFDNAIREEELSVPTATGSTDGDGNGNGDCVDIELGRVAGKTVLDVFDQSLKDVRMDFIRRGLLYPEQGSIQTLASGEKMENFEKRWREQRVAELDVLARRLRLILENSVQMS